MEFTHDEIVEIGRKWLLRKSVQKPACALVLTEMVTSESETPDCVGWNTGFSVVVEAKVSRADFVKDKRKPFRKNASNGMGTLRYYIAPKGLIKPEETGNWGLIEVNENGKTRLVKKSLHFEQNDRAEKNVLLSLYRRIKLAEPKGVSVSLYQFPCLEPKATATYNIDEGEKNESEH